VGAALLLAVPGRDAAREVHAQGAVVGQLWEYQCFEEWGEHGAKVAQRANELGKQGWELTAAAGRPAASPTWCFKRAVR
jgi:hypothetical protein